MWALKSLKWTNANLVVTPVFVGCMESGYTCPSMVVADKGCLVRPSVCLESITLRQIVTAQGEMIINTPPQAVYTTPRPCFKRFSVSTASVECMSKFTKLGESG